MSTKALVGTVVCMATLAGGCASEAEVAERPYYRSPPAQTGTMLQRRDSQRVETMSEDELKSMQRGGAVKGTGN